MPVPPFLAHTPLVPRRPLPFAGERGGSRAHPGSSQKAQIRKERFAKNRGRPWDSDETKELVVDYLNGESISGLSASLYRSPGAIKKQLAKCGVPLRNTESSYHKPELLPDDLVKEELPDGSLAWSARYCCVVEIRKLFQVHKEHGNVYDIWIFGKHNEQGCQPWYELAELPILNDVGATANDFIPSREDW